MKNKIIKIVVFIFMLGMIFCFASCGVSTTSTENEEPKESENVESEEPKESENIENEEISLLSNAGGIFSNEQESHCGNGNPATCHTLIYPVSNHDSMDFMELALDGDTINKLSAYWNSLLISIDYEGLDMSNLEYNLDGSFSNGRCLYGKSQAPNYSNAQDNVGIFVQPDVTDKDAVSFWVGTFAADFMNNNHENLIKELEYFNLLESSEDGLYELRKFTPPWQQTNVFNYIMLIYASDYEDVVVEVGFLTPENFTDNDAKILYEKLCSGIKLYFYREGDIFDYANFTDYNGEKIDINNCIFFQDFISEMLQKNGLYISEPERLFSTLSYEFVYFPKEVECEEDSTCSFYAINFDSDCVTGMRKTTTYTDAFKLNGYETEMRKKNNAEYYFMKGVTINDEIAVWKNNTEDSLSLDEKKERFISLF